MQKYFVFIAMLILSAKVLPSTSCFPTVKGTQCRSEVGLSQFFEEATQSQLQSQWCWAATISMLFSYYGNPVDQARIVTEVYGAAVDMPANYGLVIANQLNRDWRDNSGAEFSSRVTGLYDYDAKIRGLSNDTIIDNLDKGRPLIVGARTHAVVLIWLDYFPTLFGPNVIGAGVYDPWPGIGLRTLQSDELVPVEGGGSLRFVASVNVSEVADLPAPSDEGGGGGGGVGCSLRNNSSQYGCAGDWIILLVFLATLWLRCRCKISYG